MHNILIVEDDAVLSQGIALSLRCQQYTLKTCATAREAQMALAHARFDLILLDIGLPDGSGLDLCREIRRTSSIPILFLTANDAEYDEVAGLEAGGDDYMTKPFSLAVLRARVSALLRRAAPSEECAFISGSLRFDFEAMEFFKNGIRLTLSKTEQKLLRLLVTNRGMTLPRELLLERVWDSMDFVDENTLSVAIRRLRAKLGDDPKKPVYIKTVYGLGYTWGGDRQ